MGIFNPDFISQAIPSIERAHGRPQCAVCRKPVDEVKFDDSPRIAAGEVKTSLRISVRCHGQWDTIEVPEYVFLEMSGSEDLRLDGEAFVQSHHQITATSTI